MPRGKGSARGIARERQVRVYLESEEGGKWWTSRAAGSLGDADVLAGKAGSNPRLIEVKSTAGGPYERFGPKERERLRQAGRKTGFTVELAYWPSRGKLRFIPESEWPS